MDKFRETLPRILAHNTLIWEWVRGYKKYLGIWQTNQASDNTNDISRTLPSRVFTVNRSTVHPGARQMGCEGDLSVNLCERYVFGGVRPNPVYVSSSIIYGQIRSQDLTAEFCSSKRLFRGKWEILSPSSETSLRLIIFCTPLDYLYLVGVLHRHL